LNYWGFLKVIALPVCLSLLNTVSWIEYNLKSHFQMVPIHIHIVAKGFWQHAYWNPILLVNLHVY
jgi:hypothetical protein